MPTIVFRSRAVSSGVAVWIQLACVTCEHSCRSFCLAPREGVKLAQAWGSATGKRNQVERKNLSWVGGGFNMVLNHWKYYPLTIRV